MKITVVTVAYNSARTIRTTLASVASQTHSDVEHIVIDGASTDGTTDIVRHHGRHVARLVSEPDSGIYDAMNKGLALATGDLVGFLNSDDAYADELVLADIVDAAKTAGPACGFVYGDIVMVDAQNRVVRNWKTGPQAAETLSGRQIPHPAFFARRQFLSRIEPAFDPTLRIAADLKQQLILINRMGVRGRYLPRVFVRMQLGGASTGSLGSYLVGWKDSTRAYNDVFGYGGLWFTMRKVLSKITSLRWFKTVQKH
jgi:glycosyltransferase involved in cell wall biosynthesis